ncbi:MAG: response regulator [Bacteroidia bacterium]|nr:response regulator [Bacteroidia bacterium]MDW8158212.1 response regulator [Bacteroidia bacterium]
MAKPYILIVDDDALSMKMLSVQLSVIFKDKFRYLTALSVSDAWALIDAELKNNNLLPSVVITDWMMPDVRGDKFLIQLLRRFPEVPVLLFSGRADEEVLQEFTEHKNYAGIIPKPWDGKTSLEKLFTLLNFKPIT